MIRSADIRKIMMNLKQKKAEYLFFFLKLSKVLQYMRMAVSVQNRKSMDDSRAILAAYYFESSITKYIKTYPQTKSSHYQGALD